MHGKDNVPADVSVLVDYYFTFKDSFHYCVIKKSSRREVNEAHCPSKA